ncbi:uncharacterized protein GGS22DRAFT_186036 [Annulohypoxylon maeteangense]|uniref:uncharacterized protein n=1 Tax=Annulohypoxylon maeteangense TaxID=1927788 RepID=UPI002008CE41|nr:uncharacterized protein GGS22DRAFT_186036 [Annulohypoxylon maeteangense]KAI0887201.1 hypothetical protein GGS22DRAFT_186036 [Annulohypoxylon maeteangense]
MSDWKGIVKNGWHPEKEGTSLKDQMKGLIGRGDNSSSPTSSNHSAMPITSLRDPSSFGPPPKHVGSGATPQHQHQPHAEQTHGVQQHDESPVEAKPYQMNTTGLSTSHLPPPPGRKGSPLAPPPSLTRLSVPPSLPPRLPPRSGNTSPVQSQSPVSAGRQSPGFLNQGAISRLSAAGISVPGLGIGKAPPPPPNRSPSNSPSGGSSPTKTSGGRFSNLQNRLSRFGSSSPKPEPAAAAEETGPAPSPAVPTKGTSWAEKQAALKTAANFKKDPKSVSFADAKAAASTAHNFQQRHGEQVASGMKTANSLGQRFGMFENNGHNGQASTSPIGQISIIAGKKPPPPPPTKKKPQLPMMGNETSAPAPPPIPIGTRPRFQ